MSSARKHKSMMTDTLSIRPLYDKQPYGKHIKPKCTQRNVKEEDNHELRVPKIIKARTGSMYKHQYIDKQGGAIIIKAAGVSLHIPTGALSERTFISIEVKAVANCDINDLDTSTSLTPIISCKPDGLTFQKTVELILPHCAEFDDIRLHKATARFVEGHINVSTDSPYRQDEVRCVLKERYCHVYTTHFSDVVVGITNCLKKRMQVVPFIGTSTKIYVKVWIINDLPSERTILLHEQKELNLVPFSQTGKFIFENNGKCSLKVQSYVDDKKLTEVSKDIDIKQLFRNIRSAHDFQIEKTITDASQKFVIVSFLKEPVFCFQEEIRDGDVVESMEEEICASDEIEPQHGEAAQTQTESDDIIQQIFTFQTDIFKAIVEFCTDVSKSFLKTDYQYRQNEYISDIFTKVTSLQPAIFRNISSFSEDIFWKLSPDERELIKAISSFNTDILKRVSTAQTEMFASLQRALAADMFASLQRDTFASVQRDTFASVQRDTFASVQREMYAALQKDAYKAVISLRTEIFERISTFIEDTLQIPPLMQADRLHTVKTLELAISGRIEALPKEFSSGKATFVTELFKRVSSFYEDFLRLTPMGLNDIAAKVTVLVQALLQGTSSCVKAQMSSSAPRDRFLRQRFRRHQGITTKINSVHRGLFTDISSFVKGFQDSIPSFGEDLLKQISSLEDDFMNAMSSREKDLPILPSPMKMDLPEIQIRTRRDLPETSVVTRRDLTKRPSLRKRERPRSWSYFIKGGEEESSKPPESKGATAN